MHIPVPGLRSVFASCLLFTVAEASSQATLTQWPATESRASVVAPSEARIASLNGFSEFDSRAKPYAFLASAAIWKWNLGEKRSINVCWENPDKDNLAARQMVEAAVHETWAAHSLVKFEGWNQCVPGNYGIHILIADAGPHVAWLGKELDKKPNGMRLNFAFVKWGAPCRASEPARNACIKSIAVHEFGHALGFVHEQNRFDAPGECRSLRQGPDGDRLMTPYDPDSVMNYCNERYNNDGKLSNKDRAALLEVYGAP